MLHMSNGNTLNDKLAAKENRFSKIISEKVSDEEIIKQAYLICLSRYPKEDKLKSLKHLFAESTEDKRILIEDLFWSLTTSREFLFNH